MGNQQTVAGVNKPGHTTQSQKLSNVKRSMQCLANGRSELESACD